MPANQDVILQMAQLLQQMAVQQQQLPQHQSRYLNYVLPKLPKEVKFEDNVKILKKIFGNQISMLRKRFQCLQLLKSDCEDIISYGGHVNRACEDFQFQNLTLEHFKCLMFDSGLKASKYADVRTRLLSILENERPEAPVVVN